jgi:hypothetical protein
VYLRLVTSSQDKTYDTAKGLNGNPVIFSTNVHALSIAPNIVNNNSDLFYSLNVTSEFLQKGYIDIELEAVTADVSIDFLASPLIRYF